jgi:serine/threonine-protein kinase
MSDSFSKLPPRYQPLTQSLFPGGFGSVQKIKDSYLGRDVMFKSMHDQANNAQLINEIQALSAARSRHVVEIYDVVTDQNHSVIGIVIESLEGRNYADFYNEAKQNLNGYLRVLYQIAKALSDLHLAGITHRDLKLDNFKDSSSNILKLFDFGISSNSVNYITQANRGTYVYAAPELFIKNAVITTQMDVYALGVCAWALATNQFPLALQERPPQSKTKCPSIRTIMPDLPDDIISLLDLCLEVDPLLRPEASFVEKMLCRHLVTGQHKGIFTQYNKSIFELSAANPNVGLKLGQLGEIKVSYDGIKFLVDYVTGDVYVNNVSAIVGMELPSTCVLGFGAFQLGSSREWIPFSSSHPEVIF